MAPNDTPVMLPEHIVDHFGEAVSARGLAYAEQGKVLELSWDQPWTVRALVAGSAETPYRVLTSLAPLATPGEEVLLHPLSSICSCPQDVNCKHAAAVLHHLVTHPELIPERTLEEAVKDLEVQKILTEAMDADGQYDDPLIEQLLAELAQQRLQDSTAAPRGRVPFGLQAPVRQAVQLPAWKQLLRGLHLQMSDEYKPLAIGFSLLVHDSGSRFGRTREAQARDLHDGTPLTPIILPLTMGRKGMWIKGNLRWDSFFTTPAQREYGTQQAHVMTEIVRCSQEASYGYGYGRETAGPHIDLRTLSSPMLWPLLERARRLGIPLVGRGILEDVRILPPVDIEFTLEREDGYTYLIPVLRSEEETVRLDEVDRPLVSIGGTGFAQIVFDAEATVPRPELRLLPASEPFSGPVGQLLHGSGQVRVPDEELAEFTDSFLPLARHLAPVRSLDGSVEIPEPSPPKLLLRAGFRPDHELLLEWAWHYDAPERTVPLHGDGAGEGGVFAPRDRAAEEAVRERVREIWRTAAESESVRLEGARTAEFADRVLPLLEEHEDVVVEVRGTPGEYTALQERPFIRVSAEESEENDWYELGVEIEIAGRQVPFRRLFTALARGDTHLLLPDGAYFPLDDPAFDPLARLIAEADELTDGERERPRLSRYQTALFDELAEFADEVRTAPSWRAALEGLRGVEGLPQHPVPDSVRAELRPYQLDGYRWLCFLAEQGLGGILADDMGLGKTLQSLSFIARARALAKERGAPAPPFLVVAPTSVASNWLSEARKFTPHLDVRLIDATTRRRGTELAEAVEGADLVVTSYAILRIDGEEFAEREWSGLLLDEAQAVKNRAARTHAAAKRIRAPFRLAITGTPMENSLTDLWALLSLTAPGLYPSSSRFREDYVKPIESGEEPELMALLRRRVRPFLLRRTKELVAADLPEKQEQLSTITLDPQHRRLYDTVLQRERKKVLGLMTDFEANRIQVLASLTRLRMLALDPAIVDGGTYADTPSSKLEALAHRLHEAIAEGHRVIVFSQFTSFLRRVAQRLDAEKTDYAYLDGATRNRRAVVERFTSGTVPLFLISLKAGGTGLNLTEADYVFLLDPWWNPAVEAQAVDRAHRIGQSSRVMVYRLVAEGTIEEKVLALQRRKAELFDSLVDDGAAFSEAIGAEDIRELLEGP